jgi:hypothetical protein
MKTREEIRIELEAANPTTNISGVVYYPGDAQYEELMEKWIDAMLEMPPPPPIVVSMRSFREACGRELMIQINAFVASIEDLNERFKAQTDLEFATTVSRAHPRVAQVAAALNKTDAEIDQVFINAQQLDAA